MLAQKPDWSELEPFQKTITREAFLRLLNTVYAPDGAWKPFIEVRSQEALVHPAGKPGQVEFRLGFASGKEGALPVTRYWKPAVPQPQREDHREKPLAGVTIALDPGHLGGRWAKMEERWFQLGDGKPVAEGDMALITARLLAQRLEAAGATLVWVRDRAEPVTPERPRSLRSIARAELERQGVTHPRERYDGANDPEKTATVAWQSELLFYRVSEIRQRAEKVNRELHPDLTICLHFNAEEWGNPAQPTLTDVNHLHLLVNGNCSEGELALEDIRRDMLLKLLNQSAREEIALSGSVAAALAQATGLPPFEYHGRRGRSVSESPYVWARNLLASRLYRCPVVYCEPYVMNSKAVYERVQLGDYEGTRLIDGVPRKSLFREYADAVADGVIGYYQSRR